MIKKFWITLQFITILHLFSITIYANDRSADLAITAAAVAIWVTPEFVQDQLINPTCPCKKSSVNPVDRPYAGRNNDEIAKYSDLVVAGSATFPLIAAVNMLPYDNESEKLLIDDGLLLLQTVMVNGAVTQLFKYSVQRPRPEVYGDDVSKKDLTNPENYVSFYSGHTSTAFNITLASGYIYMERFPDLVLGKVLIGSGVALGLAVGSMRVASGKHFPTDALTGALMGSIFGIGVPALHSQKWQNTTVRFVPTWRGPELVYQLLF